MNDVVRSMLDLAEETGGGAMEIEFAAAFGGGAGGSVRVGFLQARPLRVEAEAFEVPPESLRAPGVVVASESVLGNGRIEGLTDVVLVRRDRFDLARSAEIAGEIGSLNRELAAAGRRYVLIGFGRWGSSDPWLGIPVRWPQISAARVIVEASLPGVEPDPSQGSHFFHNVMSAGIPYFTVRHSGPYAIDWDLLEGLPVIADSPRALHARLLPGSALEVLVDGWSGRGIIRQAGAPGSGR